MLGNYETFKDDMILRDYLALDRTILANERTLLAYFRTFIAMFASGVGLIRFIGSLYSIIIGNALILVSPFFIVWGVIRYIKIQRKLKVIMRKN